MSSVRQRSRQFAPLRIVLALLAAFAVLWTSFSATALPANAAGGTLNLTVEAVNPTVNSGEGASFRIQWNCTGAGSCDNGQIRVPVPTALPGSTAFPSGVPLAVTSQGGITGGTATIEGAAPDQVLVWNLPATVATGASGTVSFTLTPPNSVTPSGSTISPVATFTADGATTVVANADGAEHTAVTASVSLRVFKFKSEPTDVPYVDQQVQYSIMVGYESQFPSGTNPTAYAQRMTDVCSQLGVQALQNLTVVDTLEPGAQFVSATLGGVYDPVANTVTWNFGSSINDTTYACNAGSGVFGWTPPQVTVIYPSSEFSANASPDAVTNSVVATANPWGQPDVALSSDDSASHGLREGSAGASVYKGPGYDWAIASPLYRDVNPGAQNHLFFLAANSLSAAPSEWQIVDMMPCGLVSPTDVNDTDCATPAYLDLNFSATGYLPELQIQWTTNAGTTGVCTIAAGSSLTDTAKRFCDGTTDGRTPIPSVPTGEWITKFEVTTQIPAFGGGTIYIHGRPSPDLTTENVDTVYNNPDLDVDRSDVHPWYVTVENCTITNTVTFPNGQVWHPATPQYAGSNGGICGYRQVMTDPFRLNPAKSMYDPTLPGTPPAVPAVQTGDSLTVDLAIHRTVSGADSAAVTAQSTFTPTVTEYLPANLTFDADSLVIAPQVYSNGSPIAASQAFVDALGAPHVEVETVDFFGETRQRITVTFPDAVIPPGSTSMGPTAYVRFQVRVNEGVPAGTYTNHYLLTGAEGGPGISETYLVCASGTMVDADLNPTTDRNVAVGCLAQSRYTVLPVPGASVTKTVQGAYDAAPISAPDIGTTSLDGGVTYVVDVTNSGSVDISNVVVYDVLPHAGDTLTLPGSSDPRNSEFSVVLTGPVTVPAGASVQYSTSDNPCRGDLAGTGGGSVAAAPSGCDDDWAATPAGGDWSAVTAIRVDFGSRLFAAGESDQITIAGAPVFAAGEPIDGVAWNNAAIVAVEASSGRPTLPIEQTPVGLQVLPDLTWSKTDADTGALLAGSSWTLETADGAALEGFPLTIADCTSGPCAGPDGDPVAGQFALVGLPWGEYVLTEVEAPAGYELLVDPIEVNVSPDTIDGSTLTLALGAIGNERIQGEWSLSKISDPATGSVVQPGDTITYSVTAVNSSQYAVDDVVVMDDLSGVLSGASFDGFVEDDGGLASLSGETITWNVGVLAAGETRVITYSVVVNDDAHGVTIRNVVTGEGAEPPTSCTPDAPCETTHETPPVWSLSKTSDPASGSTVQPGDTITYTVTAVNDSAAPVADVVVTDDLSGVLSGASFDGFVEDDGGLASLSGETITWNVGVLAAGETRVITYSVVVNDDAHGVTIRNVVTGEGAEPPTSCTPDEPCETTHETPPALPVQPPTTGLPTTGVVAPFGIAAAALLLLLIGGVLVTRSRRKAAQDEVGR